MTKCADYMVDTYFCIKCPVKNCMYYEKHNKRERILNEDIAEFFWATCERFKQCGKQ